MQERLVDKKAGVRHQYKGYQIGKTQIYNPWSMMCSLAEQGQSGCYWVNMSDNFLLKELIIYASLNVKAQFKRLLQEEPIQTIIRDNFVLPELKCLFTIFL